MKYIVSFIRPTFVGNHVTNVPVKHGNTWLLSAVETGVLHEEWDVEYVS